MAITIQSSALIVHRLVLLLGVIAVLEGSVDAALLRGLDLLAHSLLDHRVPRVLVHISDQVARPNVIEADDTAGLRDDKHVKLGQKLTFDNGSV